MEREDSRNPVDNYCIQILFVNGKIRDDLSQKSFYIQNISKGGFRFIADVDLEAEDRIQVMLRFPDGRSQEVYGRICYSDDTVENQPMAFGFSIIDGFYSLFPRNAEARRAL